MRFAKYHGAGNDFLMLPDLQGRLGPLEPELVEALCDRHRGVGADGVIRIIGASADPEAEAAGASYRFDLYNADGLPAEVSGNGLRCLAAFEKHEGRLGDDDVTILTGGAVVTVRTVGSQLSVDMGKATLERAGIPMTGKGNALRATVDLDGDEITGTGVGIGNPHFVIFTDDIGRGLDRDIVHELGPRLEVHPDFPERVNVEFVEVTSATTLHVRTWERGVGETQACGSGACAVAVAASSLERTGPHVIVSELGGDLEIEIDEGGHVWLTGDAEKVFDGEIDVAWLRARGLDRFAGLVAS